MGTQLLYKANRKSYSLSNMATVDDLEDLIQTSCYQGLTIRIQDLNEVQ